MAIKQKVKNVFVVDNGTEFDRRQDAERYEMIREVEEELEETRWRDMDPHDIATCIVDSFILEKRK